MEALTETVNTTLAQGISITPASKGAVPMRLPTLDLLRFFAALSVVLYHFTYRPTEPGLFTWLQPFTKFGYLGVDVFFIVSGFVILMSATGRSVSEYLISRGSRLYPSFWTAILVTTAVLLLLRPDHVRPLRDIALNFTMVPGYLGAAYVDDVYWTLAIELKFYFLILLALLFRANMERWAWAWLLLTAACYLPVPHALRSLALFPYGAYFIAGMMFYLVWKSGLSLYRVVALAMSYVLTCLSAVERAGEFTKEGSAPVAVLVLALAFCVFTMISLQLFPELKSRFWLSLGAFTYPVYLIHNEVGKAVFLQYSNQWVSLFAAIVVVSATTWLMTTYVEKRVAPRIRRSLTKLSTRPLANAVQKNTAP
jgi:peptidoglycan/LPS O-acetylase OafA/YrhL